MKRLGALLLCGVLLGCQSMEQLYDESYAYHHQNLAREAELPLEVREILAQNELWFNDALWEQKNRTDEMRLQDYAQCLQTAGSLEEGISAELGERYPIQTVHLRATTEICMLARGYTPKDSKQKLICEERYSEILPICEFTRKQVATLR